jgi:MinD superfamily P-loop ATPase
VKIIGIYNIKGGVGKTATAVNLAYLAAEEGNPSLSKLAASGSFSRSRLVAPKRHEENAGAACKSLIKISRISTSHQARAIQCFSARKSSAVVMSGN